MTKPGSNTTNKVSHIAAKFRHLSSDTFRVYLFNYLGGNEVKLKVQMLISPQPQNEFEKIPCSAILHHSQATLKTN